MISAVFVFAIMDATMKRLSSHYAPIQISCLRSLASLICIAAPIVWRRSWRELRATSPLLHVVRGVVFWYFALVTVGAGALSIAGWQPIQSPDWKWLAAIGVSGALGQYWLTDAFRRAPASVVGPFEYTAILWAFLIDWIFWSAHPSLTLVLGTGVVISSGIFVIFDETRMSEIRLMQGAPLP
jgi:drug/metabolite transporter (DMT)-like permease